MNSRAKSRLLLLPVILALLILTIFPILYLIYKSFFNYNMEFAYKTTFAGIGNYKQAFGESRFWDSLKTSMVYTTGALLIELILGFGIALLLNRSLWGSSIIRIILASPLVLTPSVTGIMWRLMYNPQTSILNHILISVGIKNPPVWVGHPSTALLSVIITDVWQWTPFVWLILLAGLISLPPEPLEAANVDGASAWQMFRYVILPLMSSKIWLIVMLRGLSILKDFDKISVLTGGGPGTSTETLSLLTYRTAFWWFEVGYASALSIIFLIIVMTITMALYTRIEL
jgi:multiple sugar transport system permease protein